MPLPSPGLSLKGRALRALAARELSRSELQAKLAPHVAALGDAPADDNALPQLLDELAAKGYQSDERAAQALAHRRAPKLGSQRVVQELKARGMAGDAVAQVVEALRGSELQRAHGVWAKKFGDAPRDSAERGKQMRFLAGRGFSGDIINRVLRDAGKPGESGQAHSDD